MSEVVHITYIIDMELPDILGKLNEEADLLRDGNDCASDDELADLFGEAAEEITRLRKEIAEALYRNQEADAEITRLREQIGRAHQSYQQCDSDRRDFAEKCRVLRQERDDSRTEAQRLRAVMEEEVDEFNAGCAWAKFNSECA